MTSHAATGIKSSTALIASSPTASSTSDNEGAGNTLSKGARSVMVLSDMSVTALVSGPLHEGFPNRSGILVTSPIMSAAINERFTPQEATQRLKA